MSRDSNKLVYIFLCHLFWGCSNDTDPLLKRHGVIGYLNDDEENVSTDDEDNPPGGGDGGGNGGNNGGDNGRRYDNDDDDDDDDDDNDEEYDDNNGNGNNNDHDNELQKDKPKKNKNKNENKRQKIRKDAQKKIDQIKIDNKKINNPDTYQDLVNQIKEVIKKGLTEYGDKLEDDSSKNKVKSFTTRVVGICCSGIKRLEEKKNEYLDKFINASKDIKDMLVDKVNEKIDIDLDNGDLGNMNNAKSEEKVILDKYNKKYPKMSPKAPSDGDKNKEFSKEKHKDSIKKDDKSKIKIPEKKPVELYDLPAIEKLEKEKSTKNKGIHFNYCERTDGISLINFKNQYLARGNKKELEKFRQSDDYNFIVNFYGIKDETKMKRFKEELNKKHKDIQEKIKKLSDKTFSKDEEEKITDPFMCKYFDKQVIMNENDNQKALNEQLSKSCGGRLNPDYYYKNNCNIAISKSELIKHIDGGSVFNKFKNFFKSNEPIKTMENDILTFFINKMITVKKNKKFDKKQMTEKFKKFLDNKGKDKKLSPTDKQLFIELCNGLKYFLYDMASYHNMSIIVLASSNTDGIKMFSAKYGENMATKYQNMGQAINNLYKKLDVIKQNNGSM